MKRTNETIFAEIMANEFITESDMKLLKNRSNKEGRDLFDYNLIDKMNDGYGISLEKRWANKGLQWLKSLIKSNGQPKAAGLNLAYREINIINTAEAEDFRFMGFYDAGAYGHHFYVPLYLISGMEYYVYNGTINVVG